MKCYTTGQEKGDPFNTGDCLIEVAVLAGLTTLNYRLMSSLVDILK